MLNDVLYYVEQTTILNSHPHFFSDLETIIELQEHFQTVNTSANKKTEQLSIEEVVAKLKPVYEKYKETESSRNEAFDALCYRYKISDELSKAQKWIMIGKRLSAEQPEFKKIKSPKVGRPKKLYFERKEFQLAWLKYCHPEVEKMTDEKFCRLVILLANSKLEIPEDVRKRFFGSLESLQTSLSKGRQYLGLHNFFVKNRYEPMPQIEKEFRANLPEWYSEFSKVVVQNAEPIDGEYRIKA